MYLHISLFKYLQLTWSMIEPNTPFISNWHIRYLCDVLENVGPGERLLINLPPRSTKSLLINVIYPCWMWACKNAGEKVINVSYASQLATTFNIQRRTILQHPLHKKLFTHIRITDMNRQAKTINDQQGFFYAVSTNGQITGSGGSCFVGETELITPTGRELIENIKVGDYVLSYNHTTKINEFKRVEVTRTLNDKEVIQLTWLGGVKGLTCTPDHLLFNGSEYIEAQSITQLFLLSDTVQAKDGTNEQVNYTSEHPTLLQGRVLSHGKTGRAERRTVFDIQVEGNHNFYANDILAHNCIILDDPENPLHIESPTYRDNTKHFATQVLPSRLNSANGVIICVQQRLHPDDLSAHYKKAGWRHISIPATTDIDRLYSLHSGKTYTYKAGTTLDNIRLPQSKLNQLRLDMGDGPFNAQYLQDPKEEDVQTVQRSWLKFSEPEFPIPETGGKGFTKVISVDCSFTKSVNSDYNAFVCARHNNVDYMVDWVMNKKLDFTELTEHLIKSIKNYRPDYILIEEKANGAALIATLRKAGIENIISYSPSSSKIQRFNQCLPRIKQGHLYLSGAVPEEFISQLTYFPNVKHDDMVDALVQIFLASTFVPPVKKNPKDIPHSKEWFQEMARANKKPRASVNDW